MSDFSKRSRQAFEESSIPVLTDRLTLPPLELDVSLPALPASSGPPQPPAVFSPSTPAAPSVASQSAAAAPTALAQSAPAVQAPLAPPVMPAASAAPTIAAQPAAVQSTVQSTVHAAVQSVAAAASQSISAVAAPAVGEHWTRIEAELRESILRNLLRRLPFDAEAIVRNQMASAVDLVVGQLAAEARQAVTLALRDMVERAVKTEIDALKARRK